MILDWIVILAPMVVVAVVLLHWFAKRSLKKMLRDQLQAPMSHAMEVAESSPNRHLVSRIRQERAAADLCLGRKNAKESRTEKEIAAYLAATDRLQEILTAIPACGAMVAATERLYRETIGKAQRRPILASLHCVTLARKLIKLRSGYCRQAASEPGLSAVLDAHQSIIHDDDQLDALLRKHALRV